ncbi:MAG: Swt1 family HEPN domain-containing protein [Pyrinomonadaceae bacterium]
MINKIEREKLYTGLGLLQLAFRAYIISFLRERAGEQWLNDFVRTLGKEQRRNWDKDLRRGLKPEELIDFHHFQAFAEEYKDLLKRDFPGKNQSLPTWLREITEVRHKIAHHNGIEADEATKTWIHLRTIAKFLGKNELEQEILDLEKSKNEMQPQISISEKVEVKSQPSQLETEKTKIKSYLPKQIVNSVSSSPLEELDIVNCANGDFRKTVFAHNVYLCPAKGGAFKHKQCKYLGIYWEKKVGAVSEIEAVVDIHSESDAKLYWVNGSQNLEEYIARAKEKAFQLRPAHLPIRVFLLEKLYPTHFIKDSSGGMFGSKIYFNVEEQKPINAEDLAEKLHDKKYSEFNL